MDRRQGTGGRRAEGGGQSVKKRGAAGTIPVAKAIYGELAAFIVNDVIAMRRAKPYATSNRPDLIGSGGHNSGGLMADKSEHE
jgi:hypothetical protein